MIDFSTRAITVSVMMVGIGLAATAVVLVNEELDTIRASHTTVQEVPTTTVAVFASSLPQGHIVTFEDMAGAQYVANAVPSSIMVRADAIGMRLRNDVVAGEPVLASIVTNDLVEMVPVYIRTRRGTEVTHTCIARCPAPEIKAAKE